jgi:lysophospholipase L1-like esterase
MARGSRRALLAGLLALVVAAVAVVATVNWTRGRSADQAAARASASAAARSLAAAPLIAVYGDSWSSGTPEGGVGEAGWPAVVAGRLGASVEVHAAPGAGHVDGDRTVADLVTAAPVPDADVVVVFAGREDATAEPAAVGRATAAVIELVRNTDPTVLLVVIGPAWPDGDPPAGLPAVRDAVQAAADDASATFLDPLAAGWFADRPELIGGDGVSPTDAGHRHLADLIEPTLRPLITGLLAGGPR